MKKKKIKININKLITSILILASVIYFIYIIIAMFISVFNVMTLQEFINL